MSSLATELPKEQARARELLIAYAEQWLDASAVIRDALSRADAAVVSGDVVAMIRSYEELRDLK